MTLKNIIKGNSDMDKDVNSKDIVNFKKNIRKEVPNYYRISSQLIPAFINKKFKLNTVRRFVEANGLNFGLQRDRNSN